MNVRRAICAPDLRRLRDRGQRGAVLVEFSLALTFLLTMGFGVYEFGFAWRSSASATSAVRSAARTVSSLGVNREADFHALSSLRADLEANDILSTVQLVVVYRSSTATNGAVPAACTTNVATSAICNVYTSADLLALDVDNFDADGCLIGATVANYCPADRNPIMASADYVGVWVKTRHEYHTKLFGSGIDIKRSAVMRIEPRVG
jgi:Flp pilus assembly protein TadG